jgi:putative acetyltransferase
MLVQVRGAAPRQPDQGQPQSRRGVERELNTICAMGVVRIRSYRPGDEHALADVFFSSVREAGLADYSQDQVRAWAPRRPHGSQFADRAKDGRLLLVAVSPDDQLVAYADLEDDGHIDHVYCLPAWVGQGVGSALCDAIETEARARGMRRLFVEASEAARRLFERRGFRVVRRNDLEVQGVRLHNFYMEKDLPIG